MRCNFCGQRHIPNHVLTYIWLKTLHKTRRYFAMGYNDRSIRLSLGIFKLVCVFKNFTVFRIIFDIIRLNKLKVLDKQNQVIPFALYPICKLPKHASWWPSECPAQNISSKISTLICLLSCQLTQSSVPWKTRKEYLNIVSFINYVLITYDRH